MSTRPALRPGFGKEPPHLRPGTEGSYGGLSSTLPLCPPRVGTPYPCTGGPSVPPPLRGAHVAVHRAGRGPGPPRPFPSAGSHDPRGAPAMMAAARRARDRTDRDGRGRDGTGPGTSLRAPPAHDSAESGAAGERGEGRCWCSALS